MTQKFEFEVSAEYYQFCIQDESSENLPEWTDEEVERLLAVKAGIIGVGTISMGLVRVVVEIGECEPTNDIDGWDQVNECNLQVQSGRLVIAGITDTDAFLFGGRRIDLEPGAYRIRLYYGDVSSPIDDRFPTDHYRIVVWKAAPGPLRILKRRRTVSTSSGPNWLTDVSRMIN